MSFETLGLAPEILSAIRACGYSRPTPIQEQAIPHLLTGRDLMGCAQTGTGKTAAFTLPILQQLRGTTPGRLRALVLVPTRELAIQVGRNVREYSAGLDLRSTAVFGGVPIAPQEMMLRHGVDILVATPGRLKDLLWRGWIDFRDTCFLVLDEGDRMLDMGFIDDVREIVALIPRGRQTMLFSATLEPEIRRLARDILRDPVRIEVAPPATVADGIEHLLVRVEPGAKRSAMERLLRRPEMTRTLVFARTRRGTQQLAVHLQRRGHRVSSIHSDKTQSERTAALEAFRSGRVDLLVATDIAARGLDVQGISHVVNYDLPRNPEDYVHRIGRTARAGKTGVAISLVTPADLDTVRSVERLIGRPLGRNEGSRPSEAPARQAPARRAQTPSRAGTRETTPRDAMRGGTSGRSRASRGGDRTRSERREGASRRRSASPPPARPAVSAEKPGLLRRMLDHLGARRSA